MEGSRPAEGATPYREALALAGAAIEQKGGEEFAAYAEALNETARDLAARYPDHALRKIWHVIAASTPGPEATIEEDFPGEDAVLPFLRKIA